MKRLPTILAVLLACGFAAAQPPDWTTILPSDSQVPIPPIASRDPAKLFGERLAQLKRQADLSALLQQGRGPNGSLDLARLQRMMQDNPDLVDRAKEMLKGIDLADPRMSGLIADIVRQNNWSMDPDLIRQMLERLQHGDAAGGADAPAIMIPKPPRADRNGAAGDPDSSRSQWSRDIIDWANRLPKDRLKGTLRDSPALKKFVQDLTNGPALGNRPGEGIDAQMARWQERWEGLKSWLPQEWPDDFKFNLGVLGSSDIQLPSFDLGGVGDSSSAAPTLGAIADFLPVLYVVMGALIVYGVIRLLRSRRVGTLAGAQAAGPWPIAPGAITSRRQLIRAFDHLAVVRCGPPAKAWHHRAVAERLPRGDHETRAAAALASAYEWARYSPDPGEPPPEMLVGARRDLASLAEAAK